jgi:hypothetical protein
MVLIGQEVSEQLDIIPMQIRVLRHIRPRYGCPKGEQAPVIAPQAAQVLPKSNASPGFLAMLLTTRYADGVPLARFETILARHGAQVPRQTLARWVIGAAQALRLSIGNIVLIALNVRFDELRRHQAHGVYQCLELAGPVVSTTTGLNADQARLKVREERRDLVASKLLTQHDLTVPVCTVDLERILRKIDANRRNLHGGRPFCFEWLLIPPLWHVDAVKGGGVHPIAYEQTALLASLRVKKPNSADQYVNL